MPKTYKANEIIKVLIRLWYIKVSQKWSHIKYKNNNWNVTIIPYHNKEIPYGTFVSICKQINIETKEFIILLNT